MTVEEESSTREQTPQAAASLEFVFKTVIIQVIALGSAFFLWPLHHSYILAVTVSTVCAYAAVRFLGLPVSWQAVNTALPVAAACSLTMSVPSWLFSIPLALLLLTYAPALWTRVPYYPTPRAAYPLILAELPMDRPFTFVDIGCGFGDLLLFLSDKRPNGTFIGIEVGPLPWLIARLTSIFRRQRNLSIQFRDMWSFELDAIDVVYTFLSPAAMPRMWHKVSHEMQAGSCFITNSFPVPVPCDECLRVRDERQSTLYIHRIRDNSNQCVSLMPASQVVSQ